MCLRASLRTFWASSQQQDQRPSISFMPIAYSCQQSKVGINTKHIIHPWDPLRINMNGTEYPGGKRSSSKHPSIVCFTLSFCGNVLFKLQTSLTHCNGSGQPKQLTSILLRTCLSYLVILGIRWGLPIGYGWKHPSSSAPNCLPKKYHWVLLQKVLPSLKLT